jgi:hypothetical protein
MNITLVTARGMAEISCHEKTPWNQIKFTGETAGKTRRGRRAESDLKY